MPSNPLTNLLEQYNSDSDDEERPRLPSKTERLDQKVDDFLKEIQHIAPNSNVPNATRDPVKESKTGCWQECFDESTGYPYYWNTQSNQVTWELPPELESTKKSNYQAPQTSGRPYEAPAKPRHNPPLNRYKLLPEKIPEGMIPKEVVERSKNRFREKKKPVPPPEPVQTKRSFRDTESDSDDGKIEMITSFGSDGSDSEEDSPRKSPANANAEPSSEDLKIGPSLPQFQTPLKDLENLDERKELPKSLSTIVDEQRVKFSLVPGYADDSDNEDDSHKCRKSLFPITDFEEKSPGPVKKSKLPPGELVDTPPQITDKKSGKSEETTNNSRMTLFLETSEAPTKAFQRKRRIGFDVRPKNEGKPPQVEAKEESGETRELIRGNDERLGLGFPKTSEEPREEPKEAIDDSDKKSTESEQNDSGISFVKGETLNTMQAQAEKTEADRAETKQEIDNILEKLKFLSEGFQSASAVQIMAIQLQTLLTAWETGDLKDRYLYNWLNGTSRELCRLEEAAAPSGWNCHWDRSHKRYYYQNESSGETRWNYPDVIGGAEEMELCTTPPPVDSEVDEMEEAKSGINGIDDMRNEVSQGDAEGSRGDAKAPETNGAPRDMVPPPPPQISSPSPPPPPRINADDMKKGKNPRTLEEEKHSPGSRSPVEPVEVPMMSAMVGSEPLPPGVDSPEIAFSMGGNHPPMEPTVIFAATPQSTNPPMYAAATIPDPTSVSIMGHHHPALLQSQLVHYPAYHQHLHNQAILAAANRLTGQDTVQFVLDFPRIYTNTQVIAKPPVTTNKESLGSALNSFYSDIASLEQPLDEQTIPSPQLIPVEPQPMIPAMPEGADKLLTADAYREKRKKKVKNVVSKKQKQVSSMVAKWQKAQNYEGSN